MNYNPPPALGLTAASSHEEIREKAFDFVTEVGHMVFATTSADGTPNARPLEVHYLDDEKNLYLGIAKGKPVYFELQRLPMVTGVAVRDTVNRLSVSVRITARLRELDPVEYPGVYTKYWRQNPGTEALYRRDLDMFRIFLFEQGDGEIFHLPDPDVTCRVRFGFGSAVPRPWAYEIDEDMCLGCGICETECMEGVIHRTEADKYRIDHFYCLECGRCAMHCPNGAIKKR